MCRSAGWLRARLKASLAPSDERAGRVARGGGGAGDVARSAEGDSGRLASTSRWPTCRVPRSRSPADVAADVAGAATSQSRWQSLATGSAALAASWFVALTVTVLGGVAGRGQRHCCRWADECGLIAIYNGPLLAGTGRVNRITARLLSRRCRSMTVRPASLARHRARPLLANLPIGRPICDGRPTPAPVGQWTALVASGLRPLDDVVLLRFGVLGSPQYADDRLPELDAAAAAAGRGHPAAAGPRLRPGVLPEAPRLPARCRPRPIRNWRRFDVPLVTESDVLCAARAVAGRRSLAAGQRAARRRFSGGDGLSLCRRAGRPARPPHGSRAVAVWLAGSGAVAGRRAGRRLWPSARSRATHLVLAIDLSHSMGRGGRLEMVQSGLDSAARSARPAGPPVAGGVPRRSDASGRSWRSRDDAPAIRELIASLRAARRDEPGRRPAAGRFAGDDRRAAARRRQAAGADHRQPGPLPAATLDQLRQLLVAAGDAGVRLDVLDVGEREMLDPLLAEWAENLGGEARPARSARQLYLVAARSPRRARARSSPPKPS